MCAERRIRRLAAFTARPIRYGRKALGQARKDPKISNFPLVVRTSKRKAHGKKPA